MGTELLLARAGASQPHLRPLLDKESPEMGCHGPAHCKTEEAKAMEQADQRESYLKALATMEAEMKKKFGKVPELSERLAQLHAQLATTAMVIEHIHDEAARAAQGG